jgi:hypothetical protein
MKDARYEHCLNRLREALESYQVVVRPNPAPDEPDIDEFVWILGVPDDRLNETYGIASGIVWDVYGITDVPFHVGVVPPDDAETHFADVYRSTA